jgi:hypothetical protein
MPIGLSTYYGRQQNVVGRAPTSAPVAATGEGLQLPMLSIVAFKRMSEGWATNEHPWGAR